MEHAMVATSLDPFPGKETQLRAFIGGAQGTVSMVEAVDGLERWLVKALACAVSALATAAELGEAKVTHMAAVAETAEEVQGRLATRA
jgi:hypothetical protein